MFGGLHCPPKSWVFCLPKNCQNGMLWGSVLLTAIMSVTTEHETELSWKCVSFSGTIAVRNCKQRAKKKKEKRYYYWIMPPKRQHNRNYGCQVLIAWNPPEEAIPWVPWMGDYTRNAGKLQASFDAGQALWGLLACSEAKLDVMELKNCVAQALQAIEGMSWSD
jgi:hypothetical protein